MKTNLKSKLGFLAVAVLIVFLASCGNKSKQAVQSAQPQDSAIVIEQETVVIAVDTILPDMTTKKK